ncbi:DNA alkylation repair protein [Janthinobacterium sp. PLB04]|uniref:DNA alkylation repair protein n=1 Tax=Janthinobacterium lividum TaxID=29581 RepID=A0AAJ4T3D0_9BURK|nr:MULTISPECIES: DNA alkylation repair protein [Janthinobacterium]KAB0325223.1 DNA alkylation repair protein [Janthinobacterium lividum]QSX94310.1 DNA alkylation repair protein [Janthinobacterium lividum]UGQ34090.1 DNA alkylation repair protein [Janthinobacterium sp. PLB04]
MDLHAELKAALEAAAEPGRAAPMQAYMREQFIFLGVAAPQRRMAAKGLLAGLKGIDPATLLEHAQRLWQQPEREYQHVALDMLALHWRQLGIEHIPALLGLARQRAWWDSVDGMAGIVGDVLQAEHLRGGDGHAHMDAALRHDDFWLRRIAMLHQLGWRADTDAVWLFGAALALAHENEFFIRKAIGWALRDYARHAPEAVTAFANAHLQLLSPLSRREALKHQPR